MLKKRLRLRTEELARVLKLGRSARSAHLQVKFVPLPGASLRSAAVVSKSLVRKASGRNALRRALYVALATSGTDTSKLKGHAVFFVRVVPTEKPAATFSTELPRLISSLAATLPIK